MLSTMSAMYPRLYLLCLVIYVTSSLTTTPGGLKIRLSQPVFDYAASVAVQALSNDIRTSTIPDLSGDADTKLGNMAYHFSGMHVSEFVPPVTSVLLDAESGVTWSLKGSDVTVEGDWGYQYHVTVIDVQDSGIFEVKAKGLSANVSVHLGVDMNDKLMIRSTKCLCHASSVEVLLRSGAGWMYDLLINHVNTGFRNTVEFLVCQAARLSVDLQAVHYLNKLNYQVDVTHNWVLHCGLAAPPIVSSDFIELSLKVDFAHKAERYEANVDAEQLPNIVTDKMISVATSDYLANSAAYVLYTSGVLRYNLTQNDLPLKDRDYLAMTCSRSICFGGMFPAAAKLYPDSSLEILMEVTEAPTTQIGADTIMGNITGKMMFGARLSNGSLAYMMTTTLTTSVTVTLTVNGTTLHSKINSIYPTITVTDTAIGPVPDSKLTSVARLSSSLLVRMLNKAGVKGFQIPTFDNVQLVNVALYQQVHVLYLSADVVYNASSSHTLYFKPAGQ